MKKYWMPAMLILVLLAGCGTVHYKPDDTVMKTMSFTEAMDKAESLFLHTLPQGTFKVRADSIAVSSPSFMSTQPYYCSFSENVPTALEESSLGAMTGGAGYKRGSRYIVRLGANMYCQIFFQNYDDAKAFADAAYVMKSTPRQARESIFKNLKQRDNAVMTAQRGGRSDAASASSVSSDVDELPVIRTKPDKNAYAIVIGIENYRQALPKADYAASDAKLVREYLTKTMGYPEANVILLTNERAAKSDFEKYFERWLFNNVEKGGKVFVYYSGHGAPNVKTGDAYLVPYDGDPTFIAETGYSLKKLYDVLGKLPANEVIVALDSCFSGVGGRSVLADGARPLVMNLKTDPVHFRNLTVLAASAGEQISSTYKEKGHGLFTYFMLKGIKNEDVVKADGSIRINDLFDYLKPQVERIARKQYNNEQTPQLIGGKIK